MPHGSRFTMGRIVMAAWFVGCSEPLSTSGACQQTFEFGNFGCAIVRGRVIDQNDMPLAGVPVGLGDGAERTFRIEAGPPEATSHGMDLYSRILGARGD